MTHSSKNWQWTFFLCISFHFPNYLQWAHLNFHNQKVFFINAWSIHKAVTILFTDSCHLYSFTVAGWNSWEAPNSEDQFTGPGIRALRRSSEMTSPPGAATADCIVRETIWLAETCCSLGLRGPDVPAAMEANSLGWGTVLLVREFLAHSQHEGYGLTNHSGRTAEF